MIAIASILVAIYAGYVGSPWWGALLCAATLLTILTSTHARLRHELSATGSLKLMIVDFGPHCFAASFGAYAIGHIVRVVCAG